MAAPHDSSDDYADTNDSDQDGARVYRPLPGASVELCHHILARISRSWEQHVIARMVHPVWRAMLGTMQFVIGPAAPIATASLASGDAALVQTIIAHVPDSLIAHNGRLWSRIAAAVGMGSPIACRAGNDDELQHQSDDDNGDDDDDNSDTTSPQQINSPRLSRYEGALTAVDAKSDCDNDPNSAHRWPVRIFAVSVEHALDRMDAGSHVGTRVSHPTAYGVTGSSTAYTADADWEGANDEASTSDDEHVDDTDDSELSDDDDDSECIDDNYYDSQDQHSDSDDDDDDDDNGDDDAGYDENLDKGKEKVSSARVGRALIAARSPPLKRKTKRTRARVSLGADLTLNAVPDVMGFKAVNVAIITDEGAHYNLSGVYALLTLRFSGLFTNIYGVDTGKQIISPADLHAKSKYYADSVFVVGARIVGEPRDILRALIAAQLGRLALPSKHDSKFCYRIGRAAYEPRAGVDTGKGCAGHGLYFYTDMESARDYGAGTTSGQITTPLVTGRLSSARGVAFAFAEPEMRLRERAGKVRAWLEREAILRTMPPGTVLLPQPGESELAARFRLFVNMLPDARHK